MNPVYATLIVLSIVAVGEIVSIMSKAKVPTLLVMMVVIFTLFKTGIVPTNVIEASTFTVVGTVLQPALLVHMGTLIPMKVIKSQYKAVVITLIGLTISVALILLIVPIFFDYQTAVAGAGPMTGGIIAYIVTAEALKKAGLAALVLIPIIVLTLHSTVGMPLTSFLLRRHAKNLQRTMDAGTFAAAAAATADVVDIHSAKSKSEKKTLIPEKYLQSSLILLFLVFIGSAIAIYLQDVTGISYSLWGLAIGIIGSFFGIFPEKVLEKANGFSIAMVGLIFMVLASLATVTIKEIVSVLPAAVTIIIIGVIGLILGGFIGSKLFKWDPNKGIAVVLTAMYGFPGDFIITQEVSRSMARTKDEEEKLFNEMLPSMLMGGFTSVTIGSVIIASILVKTL